MSFKFNEIPGTYLTERYDTMLKVEEHGAVHTTPYNSGGNVCIGIGFNLFDSVARSYVLKGMGITDPVTLDKLNAYLGSSRGRETNDEIQDRLDGILGKPFVISDEQAKAVFNGTTGYDGLAKVYEDVVTKWASKKGLSVIPESTERLALFSLAYCNVLRVTTCPSLALAISEGNRAEAWYEIRYNSNNINSAPGIAMRRFYEAEIFGLYDAGDTPKGSIEAMQVYQMYSKHRPEIQNYEMKYGYWNGKNGTSGNQIVTANKQYHLDDAGHKVRIIDDELKPSNDILFQQYVQPNYSEANPLNPLNVQVLCDDNPILKGEDTTYNTGSNADLLIGRDGGNDDLYGYSGNDYLTGFDGDDVLIGGGGNDILDGLDGGNGGDYLAGGAGVDIYKADNDDTIYDEDGRGKVFVGSSETCLRGGSRISADELFISDDGSQVYSENADGSIDVWTRDGHVHIASYPNKPAPTEDAEGTHSGMPLLGIPLLTKKKEEPPPLPPDINDPYEAGKTFLPPRDPLALDLDRDGIETIGATGTVLFDHDGDGVKEGTGWIGTDDGLLVLDRNGNGQIDTGAELFGVDTVLANGQKASNGFAALRDLDTNGDEVFNAQDSQFENVCVWRDLNQNGTSQEGELSTLQALGITAINLNATAEMINLGNGNLQTATATYVRADGTTGEATGVGLGAIAANLEFAQNPFYRKFTDSIPLTDQARLLPDMQGSGKVRDLWEAISLSPELGNLVSAYTQQTTRAGQLDLLDDILSAWGETSGMATSVEQASVFGYRLIYLHSGQLADDYEALLPYWDADESGLAALKAEQRQTLAKLKAQQAETAERMGILERFNGSTFVTVDANGVTTGQGWRLDAENSPGVDGVRRVYVSLLGGQDTLLDNSYHALSDAVYSGLTLQTRLKPYLDAVVPQVDTGRLVWSYPALTAALEVLRQTDPKNALINIIELHKMAGAALYSGG